MKKSVAFALSILLAFSLTACGEGGTSAPAASDAPSNNSAPAALPAPTPDQTPSPAESPQPSEPEPLAGNGDMGRSMASLIQWMMDGTFSYDYTITSEGPEGTTEGSGSMAVDGENMAVRSEMHMEGELVKSRVIQKDGKLYMVDDANKFIMEVPAEMNVTEDMGMMPDYADIRKIGEGTGEIDGKTLPYEEYEGEAGAAVRYYLDGGDVYGIESDYEGYKTVMIITNASGSIPAGAFDLPEGYAQM